MEEFNLKLCDERHENIKEEFAAVWKRMNGMDKKLWTIIILLITNLAGFVIAIGSRIF